MVHQNIQLQYFLFKTIYVIKNIVHVNDNQLYTHSLLQSALTVMENVTNFHSYLNIFTLWNCFTKLKKRMTLTI